MIEEMNKTDDIKSLISDLQKCCGQRGARLQILHDYLTQEMCAYPFNGVTLWDRFVSKRRSQGETTDWFDDDGVPR